jgi:hypothetical protein
MVQKSSVSVRRRMAHLDGIRDLETNAYYMRFLSASGPPL